MAQLDDVIDLVGINSDDDVEIIGSQEGSPTAAPGRRSRAAKGKAPAQAPPSDPPPQPATTHSSRPKRAAKTKARQLPTSEIQDAEENNVEDPNYQTISQQGGASSAPKKKAPRKRKAKAEAEDAPAEKRVDRRGNAVRYSKTPSQKISERLERALPNSGHRLFLINSKLVRSPGEGGSPDGAAAEYAVLGATGNVYTVTISRHPSCTCPDHKRGNVCKHIMFVMIRVLKLGLDNPLVWQKALLPSEADEILSGQHSAVPNTNQNQPPPDLDVLAPEQVLQSYHAATSSQPEQPAEAPVVQPHSECAICFEELVPEGATKQENIEVCMECKNGLHTDCFNRWAKTKKQSGCDVTCPYCRTVWPQKEQAGMQAGAFGAKYLNLASASTAHRSNPQSLHDLYGDRAMWIHGNMGRRRASNLYSMVARRGRR